MTVSSRPRSRPGRVVVVANPQSGRACGADEVGEMLRRAGVRDVISHPTTADDPGVAQARAAAEEGADLVLACGGDGTVRACAQGLAHRDVPLAIVPTGTGNLLARNLGIPRDIEEAIAVALAGDLRRIDLGQANGEIFGVMAGCGFDAFMMRDADSDTKARIGSLAYVKSALRHLHHRPVRVRIDADGGARSDLSGPATMVLAGNFGTLPGGLAIFPDADATDGCLEIAVMDASTIPQWLHTAVTILRRSGPTRRLRRHRTDSVIVRADRPRPWELDGEERPATTELRLRALPGALLVCVPAASSS